MGSTLPATKFNHLRVPFVGRTTRAFYLGTWKQDPPPPEGQPSAIGQLTVPKQYWTQVWTLPTDQTVASALLTGDGAALFERRDGTNTWLTKVGRFGEAWSCQLGQPRAYDDSGLLIDGMWISFDPAAVAVDAYAIPQERASAFGWLSTGGSFSRDYREVP